MSVSPQIPPRSGIACCTEFSTLLLGKLHRFLLHPFHELIQAKYCLSCLPRGSFWHFILCCCPFKFLLPGLCCCLPAAALSHHCLSCLTESKLVGCRVRSASRLTFKGDMSHRQHVFSSHELFSPQSTLWNLLPETSSGVMQFKSCFSFVKKKEKSQTKSSRRTCRELADSGKVA